MAPKFFTYHRKASDLRVEILGVKHGEGGQLPHYIPNLEGETI